MAASRFATTRPKRNRRSRHVVVPAAGRAELPLHSDRGDRTERRFDSSWLFAVWVLVCATVYLRAMVGGHVIALMQRWVGG